MRVKEYTESVYALSESGMDVDTLIKNLKETLARKGHMRLYRAILHALLLKLEKSHMRDTITITLADQSHAEKHRANIDESVKRLGGTTHTTRIDPTIAGGFIAEGKEARIDQSYKKQLLTMYRSLIK